MTASKIWALIVGIVLVGCALVGTLVWRKQHPEAPEIARLTSPAAPLENHQASVPPETPKIAAEVARETAPPKPEPASGHGEPPHFDVVRILPGGETVVAGKGDPNAKVALLESGKVVAETKSNGAGEFVIVPPDLTPGDHDLTLRQTPPGRPAADSKQNVAVLVPRKKDSPVVVALAEPGKPTRMLSGVPGATESPKPPPIAAAPPPQAPAGQAAAVARPETAIVPPAAIRPPGTGLAIRSVELENGNGFFATGVAAAGTHVQIYLNGSHLADVVAGAGGQWSVTVRKGLTGGHYVVRADAAGGGRDVTARAEVPFDVPTAMAQAPEAKATAPEAKATAPEAKATAPEPRAAPAPPAEVADAAPTPLVTVPAAPAEPAEVPTPRPDIAAAAKAAVTADPAHAAPTLALAPPVPPAAKPVEPPARMAIAAPRPAAAPPPTTPAAAVPAAATPAAAIPAAAIPAAAIPAAAIPAAAIPAAAIPAAAIPAAAMPVAAMPVAADPKADAIIESVETTQVISGDNLWKISRAKLGEGHRFTQIYAANTSQIRDPKLIYPGQVFVVPPK